MARRRGAGERDGRVRKEEGLQGANHRWRHIFAPEIIFCASAAAALSPYLLWTLGAKPPVVQRMNLTYLPALVWGCGLLSFLVGARLAHRFRRPKGSFQLCQRNLPVTFLLYLGIAVVFVQVYFAAIDVYGTVPLLDYLSSDGGADVGTANAQQQYSGFGQLGLFTASLYAINPLLLLAVIQWVTWRRGARILIGVALLLVSFAHLLNAKRQGLYSALFYLLVGLSVYFGDPTRAFSALLPWRRSPILTRLCLASVFAALVFAFGYLASIRTQGRVAASTEEVITYLQYPLVNFEAQCAAAGVGPGEFKLLGPLRNLVPYKYGEVAESFAVTVPRVILSSPSGIYEYIQWCWGITGIVLYSFLLGLIARWLFDRAVASLACLLSYCYVAVALAMAHSNNQTLILSYGPIPLLFVLLVRPLILTERLRQSAGRFTAPQTRRIAVPVH